MIGTKNVKNTIIVIVLLLCSIAMNASPAWPGITKSLLLKDGTTVKAHLSGDEHAKYWLTDDKRIFAYEPVNGVYTELSEVPKPKDFIMTRPTSRIGGTVQKVSGKRKSLVVLVSFADQDFSVSDPKSLYQHVLNGKDYKNGNFNGSARDYFLAQSQGKFDVTFDVVSPVKLSKGYAKYGYNNNGRDAAPEEMVTEALKKVASQVNFRDYDWDGDGVAENIMFVYAGHGEADTGEADRIWPHQWSLVYYQGYTQRFPTGEANTYACAPELNSNGDVAGVGIFCHEYSHGLGLPDLYNTASSGDYGPAYYSIMSIGSYLGNGYKPCNYSAYEKNFVGWVKLEELKSREYKNVATTNKNGKAFVVYNQTNRNQYYILENRERESWDIYYPVQGLVMTSIDYNSNTWANNTVNNDPQRYGVAMHQGQKGEKLYNYTLSNTSINANGTLNFSITGTDTPTPSGETTVFSESFDNCNGTGGNDGKWGGDTFSATFNPDNSGWYCDYQGSGYQCGSFGYPDKDYTLYLPQFNANGQCKISFKAAGVESDNATLSMVINGAAGNPIHLKKNMLKGYNGTFDSNGTTTITFRLHGQIVLDDVKIVLTGKPTKIDGVVNVTPTEPQKVYDLQGRYVGKDTKSLPKGIYIIGGKKVVVR